MIRSPDELLVEQCREGRPAALAEVCRRHRALICSLARRVAGGAADLDDVVQDTLVAIVTGIRRFRGEAKLSTWIAGTTVRVALRHAQRRGRESRRLASLDEGTLPLPDCESPAGDPVQAAETHEFLGRLEVAISALAPEHRAVVALRHIEEMSVEEIAQALSLPIGTVKSRLHHARRALRQLMEPYLAMPGER